MNFFHAQSACIRIWFPFSNKFFIVIQIQWKIGLTVTPLPGIVSLQNAANAMTTELLCHVENFIVINQQ